MIDKALTWMQRLNEAVIFWPLHVAKRIKNLFDKTNHVKEVHIEIKDEIVPVKVSKYVPDENRFISKDKNIVKKKKEIQPSRSYEDELESSAISTLRYLKINHLPGPPDTVALFKIGNSQLDGFPVYRSYLFSHEIENLSSYYDIEELYANELYK